MYFFSPSTLGFYLQAIHGTEIPADAKPITLERFNQLVRDRLPGQVLVVDMNGSPMLDQAPEPTLDEVLQTRHASKTFEVDRACEASITDGFWSAALGDRHQYSSALDDQLNLTGAILHGLDTPYACRDEQGLKAYRMHSAGQLRQVWEDFSLFKLSMLQRAQELKNQLDLALSAKDLEAIEAIGWEVNPT